MLTVPLPDPAYLAGQSVLLVLAAALLAAVVTYASRSRALVPVYAVAGITWHLSRRPAYVRLADPGARCSHRPRAPDLRSPAV